MLTIAAVLLLAVTFQPEAIRAHMNFLASDLLEGRGPGTPGYDLAAEYVAAQFEAAGIGSDFQPITFRRTVAGADSTVTFTPDYGSPHTFRFGEGFASTGDPISAQKTISGRVVVAGYGVTAPEQKYDDYAGVDVRGKIVAFFSGSPRRFPDTLRAHYSSSLGKLENAVAHGAVGIISLTTRTDAERFPWDRVVGQYKLGSMHWIEPSGVPHDVHSGLSATISLSQAGADALFTNSPQTFDATIRQLENGSFRAFELPLAATIRLTSSHERVVSANVVGRLRGSDPKLRNEYVIYSSHLDHLGITDPVNGDRINNGALDNASGIAALIEIAKAFAEGKPPRRSLIFLATTAEEKGLRGADYFANNPTVPIDSIVANINIDEILMLAPIKDVVPIGIETSDLGDAARRVAKEMNVEISPDPHPEEVVFVRSDQYPFVKRGVPAIFVGAGYKALDPKVNVAKMQIEWIKKRYHQPSDDLTQPMYIPVGAMVAEFNYRLGLDVANRTARPRWTPGNFFGAKFGRRLP
jgi:Zn-dependent M28 family amino/carboxypeptidase